jgi:hypothetical protein
MGSGMQQPGTGFWKNDYWFYLFAALLAALLCAWFLH